MDRAFDLRGSTLVGNPQSSIFDPRSSGDLVSACVLVTAVSLSGGVSVITVFSLLHPCCSLLVCRSFYRRIR